MTTENSRLSPEYLIPDPVCDQSDGQRLAARHLYWMGWRISRIAEFLELPANTISSWKKRGDWDKASPSQRIEGALEARMVQLISKEQK